MTCPLTVLMPVFNGLPYLPMAVKTILDQDWRDYQFLIIDDGSSDGSGDYLRSIEDSRVNVLFKEHSGLIETLNFGLNEAKTEWIARMDADDLSHPTRLSRQMDFLNRNPTIDVLGSHVEYFTDGNMIIDVFSPPMDHEGIRKMLLSGYNAICHGSIVYRRAAVLEKGGYNPNFPHAEDYKLMLDMIDDHKMANLGLTLYRYRQQLASICFNNYDEQRRNFQIALESWRSTQRENNCFKDPSAVVNSPSPRSLRSINETRIGFINACSKNRVKSLIHYLRALAATPWSFQCYLNFIRLLLGKPLSTRRGNLRWPEVFS